MTIALSVMCMFALALIGCSIFLTNELYKDKRHLFDYGGAEIRVMCTIIAIQTVLAILLIAMASMAIIMMICSVTV